MNRKRNFKRKSYFILLMCFMLLGISACTRAGDGSEADSKEVPVFENFNFDKAAPQYYMSRRSAACEKGYYYIGGEPVSEEWINYLYFYDIALGEEYPVCSKATCSHNDETCDAHKILENIFSNAMWYYEDRLYMIERTQEYDRIISYDLNGRDRKDHTILTVDGDSILKLSMSNPICFNDGYVYYIVLHELKPMLYRAGIADNSKPEFITEYDNSNIDIPEVMLTAMPGRVYVNLTFTSQGNYDRKYYLDYYDTDQQKFVEVMKTDNEKDSEIVGWNYESILFDDKHNMYYRTNSQTEYVINKLNTDTKKTEKFYSFERNVKDTSSELTNAEKRAVQLLSYDGRYLYVYRPVNFRAYINEYRETTIPYGIEVAKTLTTQINTNYLFLLDTAGRCVNYSAFKITDINERDTTCQQGFIDTGSVFGDSRYIFISFSNPQCTTLEGLELTDEKYLKLVEEYEKKYETFGPGVDEPSISVSARMITRNKEQLKAETITWRNLGNEYSRAGFSK